MKKIKKILNVIAEPFVAFSVILEESRRINEDGSWDKYWERKKRRSMKKAKRLGQKRG